MNDQPPTIRTDRPEDLLGLVPYLLGFHPSDDLVILLLADHRLILTVRADLDSIDSQAMLVAQILDLAQQHRSNSIVAVGYHADPQPVTSLFDSLPDHLPGIHVIDLLRADGHRWFSHTCRAGCCPPEGTVYGPNTTRTAAEAVVAGLSAYPSREDLRQAVRPPTDRPQERRALLADVARQHQADPRDRGLAAQAMVLDLLDSGHLPDERQCAVLAVAMTDEDTLRSVWMLQERVTAETSSLLWQRVVQQTMDPYRIGPLCQAATAAWLRGNGALMSLCLEEAFSCGTASTSRLLATLDTIQRQGLPPTWWDVFHED